jgi:hypothetical protein
MRPVPAEKIKALSDLLELESGFLESCLRWEDQRWEELLAGSAEVPPALSARLRRIHRLCRDLDLDAYAGSIVVDLIERVEALRRELERLRASRP